MAHIFHAGFITPKQKFWCEEAFDVAGNEIPPPWNVEYKHNDSYTTNVGVWPNMTNDDDTKVLGHCVPGCVNYEFDPEFWEATLISEWDLVCEKGWMKTIAKTLLFTGQKKNQVFSASVFFDRSRHFHGRPPYNLKAHSMVIQYIIYIYI